MTQPCPRQAQEATLQSQLAHECHWRDDDTCSYCGSLSPDALFKSIEDGAEIGPTDKNYKIYITPRDPKGRRGKFYFQHLSDAEQVKFIDLMNAKALNMGVPGYFYVTPFFCVSKAPEK